MYSLILATALATVPGPASTAQRADLPMVQTAAYTRVASQNVQSSKDKDHDFDNDGFTGRDEGHR